MLNENRFLDTFEVTTYGLLTVRMLESAKKNEGMVDQKIFKTAKKYGFDSVYLLH